jgi:NADPH-dependent 2,4-dienoyl-CoA reductase/sulfur reductase-like enzyme
MSLISSLAAKAARGRLPTLHKAALQSIWPFCMNRAFSSRMEREQMHYDVCIVGAGPAGLAAAIRLKQVKSHTLRTRSILEKRS